MSATKQLLIEKIAKLNEEISKNLHAAGPRAAESRRAKETELEALILQFNSLNEAETKKGNLVLG